MILGNSRDTRIAVGSFVAAFVVFHFLTGCRDILVARPRLVTSSAASRSSTISTPGMNTARDPFLGVWQPVALHVQHVADNSSSPWPVISAIPIVLPSGRGEVALIGPWSASASDVNALAAHECIFADGSIFAVRKFENLSLYRSVTVWVCDLPPPAMIYLLRKPFNSSESSLHERCLTFDVRMATSRLQAQSIRACLKPALLPDSANPYEAAICISMPLASVDGQAQNSAHIAAPEFIEYYIRHGVEQIVFYVTEGPNRGHDLRLLQPFVDSGHVSIVDAGPHMFEADNDIYAIVLRGTDRNVTMSNQALMNNDCLYRMKHRANWVGFFDVDEFLVGKAWYKGLATTPDIRPPSIIPLLRDVNDTVDAVSIRHKRFRKASDGASSGP
jgi:hypothetical protein